MIEISALIKARHRGQLVPVVRLFDGLQGSIALRCFRCFLKFCLSIHLIMLILSDTRDFTLCPAVHMV